MPLNLNCMKLRHPPGSPALLRQKEKKGKHRSLAIPSLERATSNDRGSQLYLAWPSLASLPGTEERKGKPALA